MQRRETRRDRGCICLPALILGLDVTRITRLLWDHLPPEACSFVQEYTAEVDFAIKWFDSVLKPTEPTSGPCGQESTAFFLQIPTMLRCAHCFAQIALVQFL